MSNIRKICVVVGSRANYSSIKSAMRAIQAHPDLQLQVVVWASAILDRYGDVSKLIRADGFTPDITFHGLVEGDEPVVMVKSTGLGLIEMSTAFSHLRPDVVLTVGDRFETMATTLAAAYMNIPLAHTMGGEVSGTIDESIRHAVTKFAHIHFPASPDAAERILKLGEDPQFVHCVGCPRVDLVAEIIAKNPPLTPSEVFTGVGHVFALAEPFILVSQHPVTTEYGQGEEQIFATLEAVAQSGLPAIVLWPNADAGTDGIARGIRKWREQGRDANMHFVKNYPIDVYVRLMNQAACLVGNSSSGIREGAFIGVPVVDIGTREANRERGNNVVEATHAVEHILDAIRKQAAHGKYQMDPLYGDGNAGKRIAEILASTPMPSVQKQIYY
jgi:UDP-hydrolysing UDP-N-acetyl-D-glucosamine 2-epimerase